MVATTPGYTLSPENNLGQYLRTIREYPMLEADEEAELAQSWRDEEDQDALERLISSHLRLVAKIAMGYRGYGLPVADLIAEGNVGIMQAVRRYDPDRGFRFSTYAMWWIRASIQEYILHSWSLVKMGTTAAQKKLFFNLRKLKGRLKAFEEGDLYPENVSEIATRLNVSEAEVISMNRRLGGPDQSLNAPVREDGEGEWLDWLVSDDKNQEVLVAEFEELTGQRALLKRGLKSLNERERYIIAERRLKDSPATLQNLSDHYGISRERIRQIEVRAFDKLRKSVKNALIERRIRSKSGRA